MKKIYMILAAISLLTLSLNAQVETKPQGQHHLVAKKELKGISKATQASNISFNDMLRGSIKGMESILPEGSNGYRGQMRAPLRYDATQYFTLGPFEGDNFDYGYGFPGAYDANQDVTITTELQSSEFENHLGDSIVGFRFALYGNGTQMAKVDEFVVHPATSNSILNGGYSWALKDLTYVNPESGGSTPVAAYDNIVIQPSSNQVNFSRIAVVSGNTTITEWTTSNGNSLPSGWSCSGTWSYSSNYGGYTSGTLTIQGSLLTGYSNVQVVITSYGDNANQTITIGNDQKPITTSSASYTWDISPSGYTTPETAINTDVTFVAGTDNGSTTNQNADQVTKEGVTFYCSSAGLAYSPYRIYAGTTTFTAPAGSTITKIVFTGTSTTYPVSRFSTSTGSYNSSNNVGTWTGDAASVSFTASSQIRCSRIVVTLKTTITNGSVDGDYVNLTTGQWHEFYLDSPVKFEMPEQATNMLMGYEYLQYPSSNTSQVLNPAAFNSQSTGHNHFVHLIQGSSNSSVGDITITVPSGFTVSFYAIEVYDGNTLQLLTSWDSDNATAGTYNGTNYYSLPSGWSMNSTYFFQENAGSSDDPIYLAYLSTQNAASITIANSALQGSTNVIVYILAVGWEDGQTVSVNGSSQTVNNAALTECEWDNVFGVPVEGWYGFSTNPAGDLAVQLIFKEAKTPSPTITGQVDPNNENNYVITATGDGTVTLTVGNQTVTGSGTASITIPRTDVDQTVTATATAQDGDKEVSDPTTEEFIVPKLVTASPTISITPGDAAYTITATGNGTVTLTIGDQTVTGNNGTASITIPRTDVDQIITATATAQETGKAVSEPTNENYTIPALPQTDMPVIHQQTDGDNEVITATGNGTIHMYVDGVEVTQPYIAPQQTRDYTITVTATAQEDGKLISETATEVITIPGFFRPSEWNLMTGTYSGHQSLSFVDSLTNKQIMFADSISAMTFDNRHPDHYDYIIEEEGNNKTSNLVSIPVQKTYSTMYGLYTKEEVDGDTKRTLTVNSPNTTMVFDINSADKILYNYSLYRSEPNSQFEPIDPVETQPISKIHYNPSTNKFNEIQPYDVLPELSDIGEGIVKRVDHYFTDPVGEPGYFVNYVPVIWTMGNETGRTDGKNNSYGSDIKRSTLGDVQISIYVEKSDYTTTVNGETVQPGVWPYQGTPYTVFTPKLTITGTPPAKYVANDGDTIVYVPYMFRAWCLYEHPHDFARNSVTELLEDRDEIPADDLPLLLGTVMTDQDTCTIGGLWTYGMDRLPWAFGAPVSTQPQDLTFAVRFYYKAVVKDSGKPLFRAANRDGEEEIAEGYIVVEASDNPDQIPTGLDELMNAGRVPVSTTYVNSVGMQSDRPFDGLNIVITRYSDGTTSTVKVMK